MTAAEFAFRSTFWRRCWSALAFALLSFVAVAQTGTPKSRSLLTPWATLSGAFVAATPDPLSGRANSPQFSGYLTWLSPTAVAARANFVYVADSGRRQIFRYDLAQQKMRPYADFAGGAVTAMALGPDLSLFVADSGARQVLHFSFDGRLLQKFGNDPQLARPVAVLVDEFGGSVWVADSLYSHVVVFNSLGRVLSVLRSSLARNIQAMALGPDGLYLLDRLAGQVVVIGRDGGDRYTLGQGTLRLPGAIAVDRFNRVFVSDDFDNTLKVYERGQLVSSVGGSGATLNSFNQIASLWIDQNRLYVVDRLNARIQTFQVASPAVNGRSGE